MLSTSGDFSSSLTKYYERLGNKIIFRNGSTLNELALKMWERLNFQDMDPSFLSRVLNGERLFSLKHLKIFSEILKLSTHEAKDLEYALSLARLKRYNLDLDLHNTKLDFEFARNCIKNIKLAEESSQVNLALDMCEGLKHWLRNSFHTTSYKNQFLKLIAEVLIREHVSNSWTLSPLKNLAVAKRNVSTMLNIAKETDDDSISALAYFHLGDAYYVAQDYKKSSYWLNKATPKIKHPEFKMYNFRTGALVSAYLKDKNSYKFFKNQIEANIEEMKPSTGFDTVYMACKVLEGLGRAEGLLGLNSSFSTLKKAESIYIKDVSQRNVYSIIMSLSLLRSKCEVLSSPYTKDKTALEKTGEEGISLARKYKYDRYVETFEKILNRNLN